MFAPVPHLGLIVLDEEHESTFKQDNVPRYHARDVALWRAREEKVPLVLASATPSLESWYRAKQGQYRLVEMPRRVFDRPMPAVGTIDLRTEFHSRRSRGAVSRQMQQAIEAALRDGGQVILLLNRRGFSTHIQCPACGNVVRCPNCELPLTHHRTGNSAVCHYCDFHQPTPTECPECHFMGIHFRGLGTERLEAEVRARFPEASVLRMDTDAMQSHGSHDRALIAISRWQSANFAGDANDRQRLGFSQRDARGCDQCRYGAALARFSRCGTHISVGHASGRANRARRERRPRAGADVQSGASGDSGGGATRFWNVWREELPLRKAHGYPPVAAMVRMVVRGKSEDQTRAFAQHLGDRLRAVVETLIGEQPALVIRILGPAAAPLAKLRGLFRFHLQIHGNDAAQLRQVVRRATTDLEMPDDIVWTADVDPLDML